MTLYEWKRQKTAKRERERCLHIVRWGRLGKIQRGFKIIHSLRLGTRSISELSVNRIVVVKRADFKCTTVYKIYSSEVLIKSEICRCFGWSLFSILNLVPRSLVDEAEGETWPNPIALRDHLSGMWQERQVRMPNIKADFEILSILSDFVAYNKLTTGLRHDLKIFARISKFRCFHETKQTQNEVERFFNNLAGFVFEYFCDSRRILATYAKFCLNSVVPFYTSSSAGALKLPSISHTSFST